MRRNGRNVAGALRTPCPAIGELERAHRLAQMLITPSLMLTPIDKGTRILLCLCFLKTMTLRSAPVLFQYLAGPLATTRPMLQLQDVQLSMDSRYLHPLRCLLFDN